MLDFDSTKPIYIQISEWLENEILNGQFEENDKVHSQYSLADMFNINPATAAKGLNLLHDDKVLYNRRGLGKFVAENAKQIILAKRKSETLKGLIQDVVIEAHQLKVTEEELIKMIQLSFSEEKGDE
ncbi:GntR family transcriptional regulator [Virgibacillus sp. MSJ-26]|uniref:GntR family transcriptional regulator n=1 Tax=Virgibacillus sp. MSJ-26 TaxID=2841522 RepID=UPI001C118234|nr:GntR family transcriptional regulator [Virgibacillus sp. MSJ-26]MBU5467178.1 GntR family transcriptional regulator [Virgibacillus sp. MSJ-26]